MALNAKQKEMLEMLKDPEILKELQNGGQDKELEELLSSVEVTDDDTLESLSKKQQVQVQKLVKYFTKQVTNAENNAVDKATADSRKAEDAKIKKFAAANPGMKDQEVVDLMQQRYDKGNSLEDSYAFACKALDLDPTTGVAPKEETAEEKKEREAKEAKDRRSNKKVVKKTSAKSDISDDVDVDDNDDKDEPDKPLTLDEALSSASSNYIAKHGNPFDTKE